MKISLGLLATVACLSLIGCATKGDIRTQVGPLADRLNKLESRMSQMGAEADADRAAIQQVADKSREASDKAQQSTDVARQALDAANGMAGDAAKAGSNATRAEAAATRAENAATAAEKAATDAQQQATKSERIFNLGQKK